MNDRPMISVIVPVYNVQDFVEDCIKSILAQDYDNFELIIVNDGTKDDSMAICQRYANIDKRIVIVNKENGGLSSARNVGLDNSRGDYVTFIDSDDMIASTYLSHLLNVASQGFDIVQGKFELVPEDFEEYQKDVPTGNYKEISKTYALNRREYKVISCASLYRSSLFDDNKYTLGIINEDDDIYYRLAYSANKIAILDEQLYFYRQRNNSITHSKNKKIRLDFIDIYKRRIEYFKDKGEDILVEGSYIRFCVVLLLKYTIASKDNDETNKVLFRKLFKENYKIIKHSTELAKKDKILFGIFNIVPNLTSYIIGVLR